MSAPARGRAPGVAATTDDQGPAPAFRTAGLGKRYGDRVAVADLDLVVPQGCLYGFLGPNGAGKTTTIRMLLGLVRPSQGTVALLGHPPAARPDPAALRRVGALIEEPAFWDHLSGRRNLLHIARAAGPGPDRRSRVERIDDVLRTVDLQRDADRRVREYSQGMRQRLGLARALLGDPDLLVLDEPTNGLDPQGIAEIRRLLRDLVDTGTTVFVSSHLLAEVEVVCDRVAVIAGGRLVAEGAPGSLRPPSPLLRVTLDRPSQAAATLRAHPDVDGVEPDGDALMVRLRDPACAPAVNKALVHGGFAVAALVPQQTRLEDAFLDLTGSPGSAPEGAAGGGDRR